MRILIVEDHEDIRAALLISLTDEGYEVAAAEDGEKAFDELAKSTPDLILLDMHLPGKSGIEILKTIRQTLGVPILMFTSSDDSAVVREAIAAGATDYVLKGSGLSVLAGRIRKYLPPDEGAGTSAAPEARGSNLPQILYVGRNTTVNRLLTDVARRHDIQLTSVTTGKEAQQRLSTERPVVLVIDLRLGDTDGLSLLKAINAGNDAPGVPRVMIADGEPPEIRRSATRHGAAGIFTTPISEVEFEQTIRRLVFSARNTGAA